MKLRILSTLLLVGTIITNFAWVEAVDCVQAKSNNIFNKYRLWCKKQKICNFVKKHKYKIAATVTAIIGVGTAAYCYYHGRPSCLERIFNKKEKTLQNSCGMQFSKEEDTALKKLYCNMEKILQDDKSTPEQKVDTQEEYCQFYADLLKKYNKNNNHEDVLVTFFDARNEFLETLETLDISDEIKNMLLEYFKFGTFAALRNFEALVVLDLSNEDKKIDQEKIETLRSCFRSFLVARMFVKDISLQTSSEQKKEDTEEKTWWETGKEWFAEKLEAEKKANEHNQRIKNEIKKRKEEEHEKNKPEDDSSLLVLTSL